MGGLGLRGAEDSEAAAYAALYLSSQTLVRELLGGQPEETGSTLPQHIVNALSVLSDESLTLEEVEGLSQKMMTKKSTNTTSTH